MPSEGLEAYVKRVLTPSVHGKRRRSDSRNLAQKGLGSVMYGKTVERYLAAAARLMEPDYQGRLKFGSEQHQARLIMAGIRFLCEAALGTEQRYRRFHPGFIDGDGFRDSISLLEDDVRQGIIIKIPPQFWMTPYEGEHQVRTADAAFSRIGPTVQWLMAILNYRTFTGKTMLAGTARLQQGLSEGLDLTKLDEQDPDHAQMPHLQLSNRAMRELVKAIFERTTAYEPISLIDLGSGTGGTLAEIILGLCEATEAQKDEGTRIVRIHGIEGTPEFAEELQGKFFGLAKGLLAQHDRSLDVRQFEIHEGNIPVALQELGLEVSGQKGITVVTANYVFHRLATPVKARILKYLADHCENIIFLIADLEKNASEVNRGDFNFRDNGLLNTGNVGLKYLLGRTGFMMFDLDQFTAPRAMNSALAKKIGEGTTSDAFFYVAYKGPEAERIADEWYL